MVRMKKIGPKTYEVDGVRSEAEARQFVNSKTGKTVVRVMYFTVGLYQVTVR